MEKNPNQGHSENVNNHFENDPTNHQIELEMK